MNIKTSSMRTPAMKTAPAAPSSEVVKKETVASEEPQDQVDIAESASTKGEVRFMNPYIMGGAAMAVTTLGFAALGVPPLAGLALSVPAGIAATFVTGTFEHEAIHSHIEDPSQMPKAPWSPHLEPGRMPTAWI